VHSDVTTYVTIHDQSLITEARTKGTFSDLPNVRYLCVGPRSFEDADDVVVCNKYDPNWEDFPNLYDFTGWATLIYHELIETPHCIMIQYDHSPVPDTDIAVITKAAKDHPVTAFVPASYDPNNWMLQVPEFTPDFHTALGIMGVEQDFSHLDLSCWPTTQGTAWQTSTLKDFINFVLPAYPFMASKTFGGHMAERMLAVFCLVSGISPHYEIRNFVHYSKDTHGTSALMFGRWDDYQSRQQFFGRQWP